MNIQNRSNTPEAHIHAGHGVPMRRIAAGVAAALVAATPMAFGGLNSQTPSDGPHDAPVERVDIGGVHTQHPAPAISLGSPGAAAANGVQAPTGMPAVASAIGPLTPSATEQVAPQRQGPPVTLLAESGVSALTLPGTSSTLDRGLTDHTREAPAFAPFGHQAVNGKWFDKSGNWLDTETAVSSDQLSAMPAVEINQLVDITGKSVSEMRFGNWATATRFPAVGEALPGEQVDMGKAYDLRQTRPTLTFNHAPVNGQLFKGGKWADTGTLVSADQAAAMKPAQRATLAQSAGVPVTSIRLGQWRRALIPVDARAINGILDQSARANGVPATLLKAVAWKESTWNAQALSFDGQHGKGLMQIDDRYHDFARTPQAFDPIESANYGAKYLSELRRQTGSWDGALAAYNGSWTYATRVRQIEAQQPWHSALNEVAAQRAQS